MRVVRPVLALLLLVALAAPLVAQNGAYVVRLGNDTIAVEKFTRTATRVEGEMAVHLPRVQLRRFAYDFNAAGAPARNEISLLRPATPSAPPLQSSVTTYQGDSAFTEMHRDTVTTRRRVGFPHGAAVVPVFGAYSLWEVLALKGLRGATDSTAVVGYTIGQPESYAFSAWRIGRDSVGLSSPWDVYHARVERDGRILGSIPLGGTQQWAITRVTDVDVRAFAARWAAVEAPARAALPLSPRDTVRANVGGAQLLIDYGRPSKRGRTVFGTVVPWGSTWRTGANAATQFRTDHALEMGGVVIPAGFYTLWSVPTPNGWSLVINRETGQWGTEHKAELDLFRLPMQVSTLATPTEVFKITVTPAGSSGGTLSLEWDTTGASIPFTVR